jgi:phosphate-selective porin OprO/OprP
MRVVWSAVLVASLAASAYAGTNDGDDKVSSSTPSTIDDDRIKKLEMEIEKIKAERATKETSAPAEMSLDPQDKPKTDVEFKASFTDGFHIKSTDGAFDLHIGGRVEEEYRYTFNRPGDGTVPANPAVVGGQRTTVNGFFTREEFISVDGTIFKNWGFKVNGDFTNPLTEEYYVEWKELKEFRLLFGSFKQPVSMEATDSPRFAELIQRSPMARFMPSFDLGIKAYGSFMDSMFTYEAAVTNGRSHLNNEGRGLADDNDGKEYALRLTAAPFVTDKDSFLKGFRIGGYATYAHVGQANINSPTGANSLSGNNVSTNELGVAYTVLPAVAAGTYRFYGDRYRVGGELTYAVGPFMVRGEAMTRHDEVVKPGNNGPFTYNNLLETIGYYGEVTFVVTGEDRIPNARIVPKNPFSLADGGMGALELAGRVGAARLDDGVLTDIGVVLGRNGGPNSNYARSVTLGMNWWPVQNVKFAVNYVGEYYGSDGVQLSPLHHGSHMNGMLAHFQIDF